MAETPTNEVRDSLNGVSLVSLLCIMPALNTQRRRDALGKTNKGKKNLIRFVQDFLSYYQDGQLGLSK